MDLESSLEIPLMPNPKDEGTGHARNPESMGEAYNLAS